jgi:hypothetical protein
MRINSKYFCINSFVRGFAIITLIFLFNISASYSFNKSKSNNNFIQTECNWLKISNGLPADKINDLILYVDGRIFAATQNNGVYVSADTGRTWITYNSGLTDFNAIDLDYNANGYLFLATQGGGVFQRKVGQTQWMEINSGLSNLNVHCLLASQFNGLAAGTENGYFVYNFATNTWADSSLGLVNRYINTVSRTPNNYLIVGTEGNGLYRKITGSPWNAVNTGITNYYVNTSLAYGDVYLLAGTDQGLFYTSTSATNWYKRNSLPDAEFTDIVINNFTSNIYASTNGYGVYLSTNNGLNWVPLNNGLFNLQISSLLTIPDGRLLAATYNGEIYRLDPCTVPNAYITVLEPTQGNILYAGSLVTIRWSSFGVDKVALQYSTDGGANYNTIDGNINASLGSYDWLVPSGFINRNTVIKIKSTTSQEFGLSGLVSIIDSNIVLFEITNPVGGEKFLSQTILPIKWNSHNSNSATLEFSNDNGASWSVISSNLTATDSVYNYTLPNVNSNQCKIRIYDNTFKSKVSISNNFQITDKSTFKLQLLSPVSGEQWQINSTQTIRWESNGLNELNIFISTDAGESWKILASNVMASLNQISIQVPATPSQVCKIKLVSKEYPNDFTSISLGLFSIIGLHITSPNSGNYMADTVIPITWESTGTQNVRLSYSIDSGNTWTMIVDNYPALSGVYSWRIPKTPSTNCKVRIMDTKQSSYYDDSDSLFTIKGLKLLNPIGQETFLVGQKVNISWEYLSTEKINIFFSSNNGYSWETIASNVPTSIGTYEWIVPNIETNSGYITIVDGTNSSFNDKNIKPFNIVGNGIVLISPNGGETVISGSPSIIQWSSINSLKLDIKISYDGGRNWQLVADSINSTLGSYSWLVPDTSTIEARIMLVDSYNPKIKDSSKANFKIKKIGSAFPPPSDWFVNRQTGENSFIIVPDTINPQIGTRKISTGDYISIWYNDAGKLKCGGLGKWENNKNLSITVWGDNPYTEIKDGFATNENYLYKIWDGQNGIVYYGNPKYTTYSGSSPNLYAANKVSYLSSLSSSNNLTITLSPTLINLVSSNVIPDELSMESIFTNIKTYIKYVTNQYGETYFPSHNINQIGNWNISHGYQVTLQSSSSTRTFTLTGQIVQTEDYPLNFEQRKWYLIPYLPMLQMKLSDAFQSISNKILLVKDENGKSYIPANGLDDIKILYPGKGYKLITKENVTFIYPNTNFYYGPIVQEFNSEENYYKPKYESTGNSANISLEIAANEAIEGEVAVVLSNGEIIGSAKISQPLTTFTIWCDNPLTEDIAEGAKFNEPLTIKFYDSKSNIEKELEILNIVDLINGNIVDELKYSQDQFYYVKAAIKDEQSVNERNADNIQIYPNPSNSFININFTGGLSTNSTISIIDEFGRKIITFDSNQIITNNNSVKIEVSKLNAGFYDLIININGVVNTKKLMIVK